MSAPRILRRRLDAGRIANQNRLDEAVGGGKHGAAQRIAILWADDGGFERRQFRGERDERGEMVGGVNDQRWKVARLGKLRRGRRLHFRHALADPSPINVLDARVEHGDRLFALLAADNGDLHLVADMNAAEEAQILGSIKRARAGQQVAQHSRHKGADPHRGRQRLALFHIVLP